MRALLRVRENEPARLTDVPEPIGNTLVRVAYSSLNYKDGLAVTGKGKVVRGFPMVPGIDLAGTIEQSGDPQWPVGTEVIVTGWGMGETVWGGYAGLTAVQPDWLIARPAVFSARQSMAIGTAGFTAMQCVLALEEHGVRPGGRPVVVTGAAGGVGSIAVVLLAKLGFHVVAASGRPELTAYLQQLGAAEIVSRERFAASEKPLESEQWAGAVDSVGGQTLAALLRQTESRGSVAVCGLAGGADLSMTVHPFILRAVNLLGISSVYAPIERRRLVWQRLAANLPTGTLDSLTEEIGLDEVPGASERILSGQVRGRTVVRI